MSDAYSFWVPGQPRPKGSMAVIPRKRAVPIVRGGVPHYKISDLFVGNRRSKGVDLTTKWVNLVKSEALYHKPRGYGLAGPWTAEMLFFLQRPKKSKHGELPLGPPDVDKLTRGVDDALSQMFWEDDAQVLRLEAEKRWSDERGPGALITLNHHEEQQLLL